MTQNQGTAPMGQLQGGMTSEHVEAGKTKLHNVQNLDHGPNMGVLYAVIDLGSHMESFGTGAAPTLKRKIFIGFEHPQLKQRYYEEDIKPRSATSRIESVWNTSDKSHLRKLIHALNGSPVDDKTAREYDLGKFLGARVMVNIELKPGKEDPTRFFEKVTGVFDGSKFPLPVPFEPENKNLLFYIDKDKSGKLIGNNFRTTNFADLPFWLRKKLMESTEGKEYAAAGGQFAEHPRQEQNTAPQANAPLAGPGGATFVMIATDYTKEQYIAGGWTEAGLVQSGRARWDQPIAAPAPGPGAPPPPAAGMQGMQVPPPAAGAPAAVDYSQYGQAAGGSFLDQNTSGGGLQVPDDLPF